MLEGNRVRRCHLAGVQVCSRANPLVLNNDVGDGDQCGVLIKDKGNGFFKGQYCK